MVLYKFSDETEISNAPLSTSLLGKLQKDILTGKLKPGQKLTEQQLCKTYGVSRTPVREALRQLETDGLVENILNRGAFVVGMTEQDYEDMFELRKAYEIQAVKWAIERITDEEMERLEETFEFMEFYTMRNDIDKMLTRIDGQHLVDVLSQSIEFHKLKGLFQPVHFFFCDPLDRPLDRLDLIDLSHLKHVLIVLLAHADHEGSAV